MHFIMARWIWEEVGESLLEERILVELENVRVHAAAADGSRGTVILDVMELTVRRGEWIALAGANGSGKSTLAKLLAGVPLEGVSGLIRYGSRSGEGKYGGASPIVMQHPDAGLIGATPWEDAVLMLERHGLAAGSIAAKAEEALWRVGLGERMHQPIESLSGGQKQLTAIAGCLAAEPELLLLDEATAMLDPDASREVLRRVRKLHAAGTTVVWITQRPEELRRHDRLLAMDKGRLLHDGEAHLLFRRSAPGLADSPAERLGLAAPYAVQTTWELETQGIVLNPAPLSEEELAEAVNGYGR